MLRKVKKKGYSRVCKKYRMEWMKQLPGKKRSWGKRDPGWGREDPVVGGWGIGRVGCGWWLGPPIMTTYG